MLLLAWLVLLVIELAWGLDPLLAALGTTIWALFVLHFAVELVIAPSKLAYLRGHWLTAASLALPALRLLRAVRALRAWRLLRAGRGLRLAPFSIFSYVTASLATFFVGREAEREDAPVAGASEIRRLRAEVEALHETLRGLGEPPT